MTTDFIFQKKEKCKMCKRTFDGTDAIKSHMHIKNEVKFKCQTCQKIFNDYSNWKRHIRLVHTKDKKYKCTICSQHFSENAKLTR